MSRWGDGPKLKDQPCPGPGMEPDTLCGRPCQSRGLCHEHARQHKRTGRTWAFRRPSRTGCDVDGCDRTHWAKGYCRLHYQRVTATGSTEARKPGPVPSAEADKLCTFPDCGRRLKRHGLCDTHSKQQARGETLHPIRNYSSAGPKHEGCKADGCPALHYSNGYCCKHYQRLRRGVLDTAVDRKPKAPKAKTDKPTSNLPDGWFKPSPKVEHRPRAAMEEQINVVILHHAPPTDAQLHMARRHLERHAPDLLEMLGLVS